MKKIIVSLIFIFCAFYSNAQDTISVNTPQSNVFTIIHFKGGVTGDYSIMIPVRDTLDNKAASIKGAITVRPQDNTLWYSDGVKWLGIVANGNAFIIDSIYVERPIAIKIGTSGAATGKQVIYFLKESGLIAGGIPLSTGCRTLTMPPSIYNINYNQYTSLSTDLTIDTSHATLNRTDRIVGDTFGVVSVIKGTASSLGLPPPYNPSSQFSLALISIPAASTCTPPSIYSSTLYDQNLGVAGGEWDVTTTGTITSNKDNTDNPLHLTKAMFISLYSDSSQVVLTHTALQDTVTSSSVLVIPTYLNIPLTNPIQVQAFLNTTAVSNNTVINSYFNPNDTGQYQLPVIPFSALGFSSSYFNKIVITFRGYDTSGAAGLYFDWIRIQKGITTFDFTKYVDSVSSVNVPGRLTYYKGGIAYDGGAVATVTPAALTKTDDTNVTLTLGGTPTTALLQATSLTLGWTGNLAATRGGTGTATVTTGDLLYGSSTNTWSKLPIGTTGQKLVVVGGLPVWRDTTTGWWSLTGNAIADSTTSFLGTTTNWPLIIKNNSIRSGQISDSIVGNTGFGYGALRNSILRRSTAVSGYGEDNTGLGNRALSQLVAGYGNTAVGSQSMAVATTGASNTAIGANALIALTTGSNNTALGSYAMSISNASNNIAIGSLALQSATSSSNVAIGNGIMKTVSGTANTGVGEGALNALTGGSYNSAFGPYALLFNTSGNYNTAIGMQALNTNSTGSLNTASGYQALFNNTTGVSNTAIGQEALWASNGSYNVGIGYFAGKYYQGGNFANSGYASASRSIFIGDSTRPQATGQENQIVIGINASGLGSNTTVLGDSLTTRTGIFGTLEFMKSGDGLKGTTTNDNATALNVGEEVNSTISTYTNYTTTATYQNITSIALTAGDWDVTAFYTYSSNSATITAASNAIFVISTTTASAAGATEGLNISYVPQAALLGTSKFSDAITPYRVSLSGSTTYYLNSQATFTLGNPQFVGSIRARRMR